MVFEGAIFFLNYTKRHAVLPMLKKPLFAPFDILPSMSMDSLCNPSIHGHSQSSGRRTWMKQLLVSRGYREIQVADLSKGYVPLLESVREDGRAESEPLR